MIFYFSGTGNSQRAAKHMAEVLCDELVSINECLRKKENRTFQTERPLVFMPPTYAWQMPKAVERWFREANFKGGRMAYFVLTCAGSAGNAAAYAKKLCAEKGLRFCGLAPVAMPNNYVALSNTPDKEECAALLAKARERIASLSVLIQKEEPFPDKAVSLKDRMNSGVVNGLYYALFVHDKGFSVSDKCISCGKCAQRCPMDNIRFTAGKPVWNGNCTHCMACIGGCPTQAIEYKSTSKGNRRYYIMED